MTVVRGTGAVRDGDLEERGWQFGAPAGEFTVEFGEGGENGFMAEVCVTVLFTGGVVDGVVLLEDFIEDFAEEKGVVEMCLDVYNPHSEWFGD